MVDSINFYGISDINQEITALKNTGIINEGEAQLLFGDGYAKRRNIIIYFAIKHKMDRLIFIDDDEYPIAMMKNEYGRLLWTGQSVVGTHLKYISDANITHGHHCGYISPIPYISFNEKLTENDFKLFIEAISNDIISWDKVKNILIHNKGVTYANPDVINHSQIKEVQEENGMKFISAANLCFNLKNTENLPPFYNPHGARGEDTFMSTSLSKFKVLKVPCYTFHDAFLMYKNLLNGVLPTSLEAVDSNSPVVIKRFINATIGWIRYKPLLVYITKREGYETIMKDINDKLSITIPKLCDYFNTKEFEQVQHEFEHFHKKVEKHYNEFQEVKKAWSKVMKLIH
jgi:hypothetical protein